jgi:hypothetical protein
VGRAGPLLFLIFCLGACAGRARINSNCTWTPQTNAALRDDAELAEDLAIRYADAHRGHRSGHYAGAARYASARDDCMASLFALVARDHGVTVDDVRAALLRRPPLVDAAIIGAFLTLVAAGAVMLAGWMFRAFEVTTGVALTTALAVAAVPAGIAGWIAGELWSAAIEMMRLGNDHMSYRAMRSPWSRHSAIFFLVCIALFSAAAVARFSARRRSGRPAV